MTAPGDVERRRTQAYRNRVTALVLGGIVFTLGALYVLLLPGASGAAGALCTIGFLVVAFFGWEYLMKPGYGFLHRGGGREEEEAEGPRSPGAP